MAPFIVNHPVLFNNWIMAREEAIARVRAVATPTAEEIRQFRTVLEASAVSIGNWTSAHPLRQEKLHALGDDLAAPGSFLDQGAK